MVMKEQGPLILRSTTAYAKFTCISPAVQGATTLVLRAPCLRCQIAPIALPTVRKARLTHRRLDPPGTLSLTLDRPSQRVRRLRAKRPRSGSQFVFLADGHRSSFMSICLSDSQNIAIINTKPGETPRV